MMSSLFCYSSTIIPPSSILLYGPTASGKSSLALRLAAELEAVIINVDALQIYRDIPILSAQPHPRDMALIPHRLFGYIPANLAYSVNDWLNDALDEIRKAKTNHKRLIFVGGTGLYFKALTRGLAPLPSISPALRQRLRYEMEPYKTNQLHNILTSLDSENATKIRINDRQRILRAIEIILTTGQSMSYFFSHQRPIAYETRPPYQAYFLAPPRSDIVNSIERRFDRMIENGGLDEVKQLYQQKLSGDLPIMRALGVRQLLAYISGEISQETAILAAKQATKAYAKRQMTWARHQLPEFTWGSAEEIEARIHTSPQSVG